MSTITKERLLKIQQWRETFGPGSNVVLPAEEAEELARIALASLEAEKIAEPVAKVETVGVCWYADNGVPRKPAVGTELYAAPPAPVSVPDAATAIRACMEEFPESVHDIVEECAAIAENACRAAMFHGEK